jgi:c-di-GMP-binding flagellar brake protein YcgR
MLPSNGTDRNGLPPGATIERRATVRYPCHLKTTCEPLSDEPASSTTGWTGELVNISAGGVGVVLPQAIPLKSMIIIELQGAERQFQRALLARVVHVRQESAERWMIGCSFAGLLRDKELKAILEHGRLARRPRNDSPRRRGLREDALERELETTPSAPSD